MTTESELLSQARAILNALPNSGMGFQDGVHAQATIWRLIDHLIADRDKAKACPDICHGCSSRLEAHGRAAWKRAKKNLFVLVTERCEDTRTVQTSRPEQYDDWQLEDRQRAGGQLKGRIEIKPGFDDLPEGFAEAFEIEDRENVSAELTHPANVSEKAGEVNVSEQREDKTADDRLVEQQIRERIERKS